MRACWTSQTAKTTFVIRDVNYAKMPTLDEIRNWHDFESKIWHFKLLLQFMASDLRDVFVQRQCVHNVWVKWMQSGASSIFVCFEIVNKKHNFHNINHHLERLQLDTVKNKRFSEYSRFSSPLILFFMMNSSQ